MDRHGGRLVGETGFANLTEESHHEGHLEREMTQLLMRRPHAADICRYLVLSVPWSHVSNGAVLLRCQDDGYIEVTGSFGYPREVVETYRRLSVFDDLPLTNAARTRQPVALYNGGDIAQQFPHLVEDMTAAPLASQGALIVVPLLSDLGAVGVVGMSFVEDIDPPCSIVSGLESVAPLLGLFVGLTAPPGVSERSRGSSLGARDDADFAHESTPGAEGLSKRQLRMLGMFDKKMSNLGIARALEYSVSTVRAEALNIYRYLGVHSRREAVEEARRRGILSR